MSVFHMTVDDGYDEVYEGEYASVVAALTPVDADGAYETVYSAGPACYEGDQYEGVLALACETVALNAAEAGTGMVEQVMLFAQDMLDWMGEEWGGGQAG